MQKMIGVLTRLEKDSNWQTLHDLDVVAGRILGWQQAKAIAARARHVLDVTVIVPAEGVNVDRDPLAALHMGELRFFKIRGHPDVIGLGPEHQGLSGLDP